MMRTGKIERVLCTLEGKRKQETRKRVSGYSTGLQVGYQEAISLLCDEIGISPRDFFESLDVSDVDQEYKGYK